AATTSCCSAALRRRTRRCKIPPFGSRKPCASRASRSERPRSSRLSKCFTTPSAKRVPKRDRQVLVLFTIGSPKGDRALLDTSKSSIRVEVLSLFENEFPQLLIPSGETLQALSGNPFCNRRW